MAQFEVDPSKRFRTLPKGEYTVMVTGATIKEPKQGSYPYIEVQMVVAEGEFTNEVIIDRLSLSPKAQGRLASFTTAIGLTPPGTNEKVKLDTDDFLNRVLIVSGEPEVFKGFERFRPEVFKMHESTAKQIERQVNNEPPKPAAAPAQKAAVSRRTI